MRFLKDHAIAVALFIICLALVVFESVTQHNKDFDVFIGASRLVEQGKTCYEVWLKSGTSGLKYFYSPLFAVLLFPINNWPQLSYNLLWMALSVAAIYRSFVLLSLFLPLNKLSKNKTAWLYVLLILCTARSVIDNLALGQMTLLLVWGSLEAMRLITVKKTGWGCALLALLINIKLIPIGLLAYLFYKKNFKAGLLTILFFVMYLYLPSVFIGWQFNSVLLHDWLLSLTGTQEKSIYEDIGRSSLSALVPSLLMDTPVQFSIKRNVTSLNAHTVDLILNSTRILVLIVLAFLFGKPFCASSNKKKLLYDIGLVCIATPLIFPHQGKYAFFYMFPAYGYCLYTLIRFRQLKDHSCYKRMYQNTLVLAAISLCLITLTTDGLIGRKLSDVTEYLHLPVYGMLFLLGAMAGIKPKANKTKYHGNKTEVLTN